MKKKLLAIPVTTALILTVALLVGCTANKPTTTSAESNPAAAPDPTAQTVEAVSITPDAAIDIALKHASVPREEAVLYGIPKLDNEKGRAHYDIEFAYNGIEYEYEIATNDGTVLKAEKEKEPAPTKAPEKTTRPEKPTNNGYISVEEAKRIALENAGVKAENTVFLKAYYDADDIVPHFDVKFRTGDYEYEYEIKAADGTVLEKDVDKEKGAPTASATDANYITADEAKKLAYNHAGVAAADVKFAKAKLDRDDMIVHYDVEFVAGKYEYEYEINALTGKIIAYDKDFNN